MNRYDIKQVETGVISHSYVAEAPMDAQPAWGTEAWTEQVPVLNADGTQVLDNEGKPTYNAVPHPATYTVTVTDLTGTPLDPCWIALRQQRDTLLASCDWTQMGDSPLDATARTAWATYRRALRDLPKNTADPTNPAWPTPPSAGTIPQS